MCSDAASRLLALWGRLRLLGERLSQHENPTATQLRDKVASRQSAHNKGTVVLSLSEEFPAYCQSTVCLTTLWERYDLFVFKRGTPLYCVTVGNINDVWTMKFSLSQALPSTTTTTTGKLWQDVRYITNMWTLELSRYQIFIILWRKEITLYIYVINLFNIFLKSNSSLTFILSLSLQYYHLLCWTGKTKYFRLSIISTISI